MLGCVANERNFSACYISLVAPRLANQLWSSQNWIRRLFEMKITVQQAKENADDIIGLPRWALSDRTFGDTFVVLYPRASLWCEPSSAIDLFPIGHLVIINICQRFLRFCLLIEYVVRAEISVYSAIERPSADQRNRNHNNQTAAEMPSVRVIASSYLRLLLYKVALEVFESEDFLDL